MPIFNPLMFGRLSKYKTMQIDSLSKSMIALDKIDKNKTVQIHEYESIMKSIE
jgi:hypothetical protein